MLDRFVRFCCSILAFVLPLRRITKGYTDEPYLDRYVVFNATKTGRPWVKWLPQIYLHHFVGSDAPELHDHPWEYAVSLILAGGYWETRKEGIDGKERTRWRAPGTLNRIRPETFHRIELACDDHGRPSGNCRICRILAQRPPVLDAWTLFFTWKKTRPWGFVVDGKWVHWQERMRQVAIEQAKELLFGGPVEMVRQGDRYVVRRYTRQP